MVPTSSPCNTPILPVQKADMVKWLLVHDLRAVNEVVEDYPVKKSNPHTLLLNIPPDAKYLTIIEMFCIYQCAISRGKISVCFYTFRTTVHLYQNATRL